MFTKYNNDNMILASRKEASNLKSLICVAYGDEKNMFIVILTISKIVTNLFFTMTTKANW